MADKALMSDLTRATTAGLETTREPDEDSSGFSLTGHQVTTLRVELTWSPGYVVTEVLRVISVT